MFCKWCGGDIASFETKCKRCGKEVPALSDCGGFYDLVPNAKKTMEVQPGEAFPPARLEPNPHKPEHPKAVELSAGITKNGKKTLLGLTVVNVIGFICVILALVVLNFRISQYSNEGKDLEDNISEKSNDLYVETEPIVAESEETEFTVSLGPVLAEQNVSFTAKIDGKASMLGVETTLDFGDYTDTCVVSYGMNEETGSVNAIRFDLKEADAKVLLTLVRKNLFRAENLALSYEIDDIAYGLSDAPETCKWQCRFGSDAEWEDLLDTFVQTDDAGKTELSIEKDALRELIADYEGILELRCEISRTNTENGSLTIVVEGIKFYEEANPEEFAVG